MMNWMKLSGFVLLVMGLAACSLGTASQPSGVTEDTTANDESVTPGADMTQIHTDDVLGISITYPAGWYVEGTAGSLIQIYSPQTNSTPLPRPQGGGFPSDRTKVEIIAGHPGDSRSLDQQLADTRAQSDGPGGQLAWERPLELPGMRAIRYQLVGGAGGDVPAIIIDYNGQILHVAGYGDTTRFDEITSTLRPAG